MRLAVLAEIHGNGEALRALPADLDEHGGAARILVLGAVILPGPNPGEVVAFSQFAHRAVMMYN